MGTIEQWAEWKEKCALALCREETRRALQGFAHARFYRFAAAYASATNTPDPDALTPEPAEAWHWFETHFRLRNTREGKSFKEWLFARPRMEGPPNLDSVQAGATLLMRDVVRERLRREFSGRRMLSLDAPVGAPRDEALPSLHELLPGPADTVGDVEQRELERMAVAESDEAMAGLSRRERVALLACQLGLSLAHPAAIRVAGCGKSVLSAAHRQALVGLAAYVRSRHPREDTSTLASLTCLIFDEIKKKIFLWGKSENGCSQFFMLVER